MKSKQIQEFKETEIGKIPVDWDVDRIENFLSPEKGSIKIGPFGSQIKKEFFIPEGFKVYGQENIFKNDFSLGSRYITNERFEMLSSCELKPNDLIISMMGTIGFMAIVPKNIQKGIMDSHLLRIRIDESLVYNEFLLYALRSTVIQNQIESFSVGTIMPGLNSKIIKQLFFPIPSLSEQQRITKTLLDLDTKISNLQNQNKILEQMAQAIFKSWFVDFDGVTEFEDSELGKIPKGWSIDPIFSHCQHVDYGYTQSSSTEPVGPKFLRITDIGKEHFYWSDVPFCEIDPKNMEKYQLNDGDIVIARTGASTGDNKLITSPPKSVFASYLIRLRLKSRFMSEYVASFLKSKIYKNYIYSILSEKSAQPNASATVLTNCKIITPEKEILKKFAVLSKSIHKQIENNAHSISQLVQTRDALLPKLMSGEIRV